MPISSLPKARAAMLAIALATTPVTLAGDRSTTLSPPGMDLGGRWELDAAQSDDTAHARAAWQRALPRARARPARDERHDQRPGDAATPRSSDDAAGTPPASSRAAGLEQDPERPANQRGELPVTAPLGAFLDAITNPPVIEIRVNGTDLDVPRADGTVSCTPGDVVAVMDRHGASERRCGWRGGALTVTQEVRRGPRRDDRYELDTDGSLTWSTTVSAKESPPLVVRRRYHRSGTATGAAVTAAPRAVPAD
jgi:hypothetical protein